MIDMPATTHARNIHEWRHKLGRRDTFQMLLTSDWHYDNPKCKRDLLHRHLEEAKQANAPACCFGDLFCVMQGKYDKRSDKSDVRPEHMRGDYLDAVIRDTAEQLKPWHDQLFVIGLGNHETAMHKAHETDIIERFVQTVRYMTPSSPIVAGGYGGWIKLSFTRANDEAKHGTSCVIKYYHGTGGGGPVTKGAIQQQRQAVIYEGADIVYSGHIHEAQSTEFVKESFIPNSNAIRHVTQVHLRGATYKEEYADGYAGWHVERGGPPKPLGGWWVDFFWGKGDDGTRIKHTECRAK